MAAQEDILNCVKSLIWSGEFDEADVALHVRDHFGKLDDADKRWLLNAIQGAAESKRIAEATWPKVTDFDRLDRAFTLLEAQGVIALHRAGFTLSDGFEEAEDAYKKSGGNESEYTGYCFYTEQDQVGAMDGSGLYIAFGHFSTIEAKGVRIGRLVRAALEREGFNVEWDGTIRSRLFVKGFLWQRRTSW